jgi:hypothetical protein
MKLKQIIEIADQAYSDDDAVERAFAAETGSIDELLVGDSLAVFIAREIKETYDPDATREQQLEEAYRVMSVAHEQLENVLNALAMASTKRPSKSAAMRISGLNDKRAHKGGIA